MAYSVSDQRSSEAKAYRKWYRLKAWKTARAVQLAQQPLCWRCLQDEVVTEATVLNHRIPVKGNWQLFDDPSNHESVCERHHNSTIQREERRGHVIGCDVDGRLLDPDYPWNR